MSGGAAPDPGASAPRSVPRGELSTRVMAMPADTNANGDIFGGWLLGQMDLGGSVSAHKIAKGRTVTVAIDAMSFKKPVYVGDVIGIHTELTHIGHTSLCLHIEAWVTRQDEANLFLVTEGNFTYVAVDDAGRPRPIPQ